MKLTYLPADLHLTKKPSGDFEISLAGSVVFTGRNERAALKRFAELRSQHGGDVPSSDLSAEDRQRLLKKEVGEALVDANHYDPQKLTKARRSSRTFG